MMSGPMMDCDLDGLVRNMTRRIRSCNPDTVDYTVCMLGEIKRNLEEREAEVIRLQAVVDDMKEIAEDQECCPCRGKGAIPGADGATDEICEECQGGGECPLVPALRRATVKKS